MSVLELAESHCKFWIVNKDEITFSTNGIEAFAADLIAQNQKQEHEAWTHSCSVLCQDNVELWVDSCPHCGKPKS